MEGKKLTKKIGLYFIGNLSSKLLTSLLLPIYAFFITPDDLGYYDFIQIVIGVIIPVMFLAIWEAILKFILTESKEVQKKIVISTTACFTLAISLISLILLFAFKSFFPIEMKSINLIIIVFISRVYVQIWQYYARSLEQNQIFVTSSIIGSVVNSISILLFVSVLKEGLNGLFLSFAVGQITTFIMIEKRIKIFKLIEVRYLNWKILKSLVSFSAPLVLNLISTWLISGFGAIIITIILGTEANGMYSFASKFSSIVTMIGAVVTMAFTEEAFINAKTKGIDNSFTRTIEGFFRIFLSIIIISVPVIVIFYQFIKNTQYFPSLQYVPWLLFYSFVTTMASNVGTAFQVLNKTKYLFTTTVSGALITVGVSYALIMILGVNGVIIGQVLGAVVMLVTRYFLVKKYANFTINWFPIVGLTVLFIGISIIYLQLNLLFCIFLFIILLLFISYLNISIIKGGYNLIIHRFK